VAIAIMGATGSGKSTFINLASGSSLGIGKGLRSCTNTVQLAGAFNLDNRRVLLIDTPGFDDTTRSDTDVLKMIAAFLATSYERGSTLAGVLYFHRISDFRMGGISTRNFNMFRKLCGDNTLKNVVIVTNMWGEVDPSVGEAREAELMREDIFFKPVLDKDAQMARHANTVPSAEAIIRLVLNNHPLPLRIQEELVNQHMDISQTGAGEELNREFNAQIRKHQEEMRVLKDEMEQAMRDKDEETKRELEIETKRMQREIARFENDTKRLASDYKSEKQRLEARVTQMEAETRQESDRVAAQYQRQIDELKNAMQANAAASEREKEQMLREMRELSMRRDRAQSSPMTGMGLFSMIGATLDKIFPLENRSPFSRR